MGGEETGVERKVERENGRGVGGRILLVERMDELRKENRKGWKEKRERRIERDEEEKIAGGIRSKGKQEEERERKRKEGIEGRKVRTPPKQGYQKGKNEGIIERK